jgi:pantoate--beta-alanine ligase
LLVIRTVPELRAAILEQRRAGNSVGLVPTMGLIHAGQLSLVARARDENGCAVASITADPSRGENALRGRSPAEEQRDLALLERDGAAIAFVPTHASLFPPDDLTRVIVARLTDRLEGASRPGYLDLVTTVIAKLLGLVGPARLYLGQKDAQQIVVLRRMFRDLHINTTLVICPTVRESDGLAVSSQNVSLSIEERHAAPCLYHALQAAGEAWARGERSAEVLRARMTDVIARERMARPDYISVADAETLRELQRVDRPAYAMVAAWVGRVRLSDNVLLDTAERSPRSPSGA